MRGSRWGGAVALLVALLGCGGMMPTGGIQTGSDAARPANFPMPEPPGATLETSAEVGIAGISTMTVQYTLGGESDAEILDLYEKAMKDAGLQTVRSDDPAAASVSGTSADGKTAWTASIGQETGRRTLTLVAMTR